jgi:hypothetical protein
MFLMGLLGTFIAGGLFFFLFRKQQESFFFGLSVMALVFGIFFIGGGICCLYTRSQVEVDGNELRIQEWYGPIKTELKRPVPYLRKLVVHYLGAAPDRQQQAAGIWTNPETVLDETGEPKFGVLELVCEGAQNLFIAHTYPRPWLLAWAAELAARLQVPHEAAPRESDPPVLIPFLNITTVLEDRDTFDEPTAPPDNRWRSHAEGSVLTLMLPPLGYWRDGNWFGLLFGGFFLFIALSMGITALANAAQDPAGILFALIPLAVSLIAFGIVHRRANTVLTLTVSEEGLIYLREGPLMANRHQVWHRGDIAAVRIGHPRTSQRGVERKAVYILEPGGKEVWLIESNRVQEMRWLATVLRKTLGVPPVPKKQMGERG